MASQPKEADAMTSIPGRYLALRVCVAVAAVYFVLLGLFLLGLLAEQVGKTGRGSYGIAEAITYTLLHLPQYVHDLYYVSAVTGSTLAIALLARSNELLALRSFTSRRKLIQLLLLPGLLLAALAGLNSEYLLSSSQSIAENFRQQARTGESSIRRDLWFRQRQEHVHVQRAWLDGRLQGIRIYEYGPGNQLKRITEAENGWYIGRRWNLDNPRQREFSSQGTREIRLPHLIYMLNVMPTRLSSGGVATEYLPIRVLYRYVRYLHRSGQADAQYGLVLAARLTQAPSVVLLVLLGLPLGWGTERRQSTSAKTITGALYGLGYYTLNSLVFQLSLLYGIGPFWYVLLTFVPLLILTAWLLRRMR